MPIYEYACRKCNAHVEAFQKVTDKPLTKCRACGGRLEKQWSQTSFQLKGAGWYVTDYAANKSGATEDSNSGKAEKSDKRDEPNKKAASDATAKSESKTKAEKGSTDKGSSEKGASEKSSPSTSAASSTGSKD